MFAEEADEMTGSGSIPGDSIDGGLDDLVEELRQADPVDVEELPSSHSPEAARTLERILGSGDGEPEPDHSDPEDDPG